MTITTLDFTNQPNSTKDMIITILSEDFPISLPKIKNKLQKKYQKSISYQGIYKELNIMLEKGILLKREKQYLLNKEWILNINKFSKELYQTYTKIMKNSLTLLDKLKKDGDTITMYFNSHAELDEYFVSVMEHFNKNSPKNEKIYMYYNHNSWPIVHSKQENKILEYTENNTKYYCICGNDTPLDRWATKYENSIGMHVKINPEYSPEYSYQIYGDITVQFYFEKTIIKQIDEYFQKITDLSSFIIEDFFKIQNQQTKIKVTLIKNKSFSLLLKKEFLSNFKNEGNKIK